MEVEFTLESTDAEEGDEAQQTQDGNGNGGNAGTPRPNQVTTGMAVVDQQVPYPGEMLTGRFSDSSTTTSDDGCQWPETAVPSQWSTRVKSARCI